MNISPAFVVAAVACVVPFGLAIREDLQHKDRHGTSDDSYEDLDDRRDEGPGDEYTREDREQNAEATRLAYERLAAEEAEAEAARTSKQIKPADLEALIGPEPATLGSLFTGVAIGASSGSFLPDATREQIEAWKLEHSAEIVFDFDDVTLNNVILKASGEELVLRDAMIAAWGTPRRMSEDELVWVGTGTLRAVYSAMYDGFMLRFERFATIEQLIAPADKKKLGLEPFPLIGARVEKLEQALGSKLQGDDADPDERSWVLPGIGTGTGQTVVRVVADDSGKIAYVLVEGSTVDTDAVRDALVAKWGLPKDDGDGALTWTKGKLEITAVFYDSGFEIRQARR